MTENNPTVCGLALTDDEELLWKFLPSQASHTTRNSKLEDIPGLATPVLYSINSHGFRGEELQQGAKLLFLGCSCTFGTAINDWETLPSLVEKKIGIQAINAGVPGYGPFQCARLWPKIASEHQLAGIIWQKPEIFRFPWKAGYTRSSWYAYTTEFYGLRHRDPPLFRRLVNIAASAEANWMRILGGFCRAHQIPLYFVTHETASENIEFRAASALQREGLLRVLSSSLRLLLDINHQAARTDLRIYCVTPEDGHPNLLYNEIASDLIVANLRRDLRK